ncbi:MAG: alpha/beta fold hydrolase [Acidobacteria bacterium]|nr:alpha/beta fold hydrolase [Acidobacteriota bacterium]
MSYANNQGARIYWDEQGAGAPILLIMGLGCASDLWHRTIPALSNEYRIILFDNRGIGRSDAPPGPYSISQMADDAAAVLEAAAVETAHVFGLSMGGMIAQELALRHPARVRSLILGATNCGGSNAVHAAPEVIDVLLARSNINPVDAFWAIAPYIYDASTPREIIQADLDMRSRAFPSLESYMAQLQAIMAWESHSRLSSINIPTLVIHGETDQLIPAANADILAKEIPDAKLIKLDKASHVFTTDRPEETAAIILSFLQNVS